MILYSTGCPNCRAIENKLKKKGIRFEKASIDDVYRMGDEHQIDDIPFAIIEGRLLEYEELKQYIEEYKASDTQGGQNEYQ